MSYVDRKELLIESSVMNSIRNPKNKRIINMKNILMFTYFFNKITVCLKIRTVSTAYFISSQLLRHALVLLNDVPVIFIGS